MTLESLPPADRERIERTHAATGIPVANLLATYELAQRNEAKAAARRNDPVWRERAIEAREQAQDASDTALLKRVAAGEYGDAPKRAVEDLAKGFGDGDPRAFLRAARRAVVAARWGADRRTGA